MLAGNVSGGPWRLISAVGIVSTEPVAPEPDSIPAGACQDLPGPTVWNGSRIPVWGGSLDLGIAPFWELLFINSTSALLPIQTVNDSLIPDRPVGPTTPCGIALSTIGGPHYSLQSSPTVSAPIDSSGAAHLAWIHGGSGFVAANPRVTVWLGIGGPFPVYGIPWGIGWGLVYGTCGIPGIHGNANESDFAIPNATTVVSIGTGNATCTWAKYTLGFGPSSQSAAPGGGVWVSVPIANVTHTVSLNTWMLSLAIANSSRTFQPVANVTCNDIAFGSETCRAESPGWFAALTTDRGYWLDVLGWNGSAGGWRLPNVGVYSNETLVVYLPPNLAATALTVNAVSTLPSVQISGSADI